MISQEKTLTSRFYGRSETWGIVIQTIPSGPASFTCMTTFAHWIAVAYSDGAVKIYHAVTGALRLTLGPIDAVRAMGGSPDGSTLFCSHQESSMTFWDIQTGGLIRDSTLTNGVQHIAVSSKGRYLACRLSSGSIKVWEVANGVKDVAILDSLSNSPFCWLEPEEQLVISDGLSVHIWDIVAGSIVHSFKLVDQQKEPGRKGKRTGVETEKSERVSGVVYSQVHDWLAVVTQSEPLNGTVTIIHPRAAKILASLDFQDRACFAFSRTAEELVLGMQAGGLRVLDPSQHRLIWRDLELSHTVECIYSLPNDTIAVDSGNSGIQLLSLDARYARASRSTLAPAVSTFDQGRIIASLSPTGDSIRLLETSTTSNLLTIPSPDNSTTHLTAVLCTSLRNCMVVSSLQQGGNVSLWLYRFGDNVPKWVVETIGRPSACEISPAGTRLLTFCHVGRATWHVCVWGTRNGRLQAKLSINELNTSPPHITFDSETQFYSHHDNYHVPYDLHFSTRSSTTHSIIRHEPQPWTVNSTKRKYEVDSSREWVVCGSKKICWIPPGYIGSGEGDYRWAGPETLIMIGGDKVFRALSFRS